MAFHNELLDIGVSRRSGGGPGFATKIIVSDGLSETRLQVLSEPQRTWKIIFNKKKVFQLNTIRDFFEAREGATHSFRFRDWTDYTTSASHIGTQTSDDVLIGVGDGTETTFQLRKFRNPNTVYQREQIIQLPVPSSTRVRVGGVEQTEGPDFSVNDVTGEVLLAVAPGNGVEVKAGTQYDWKARFSKETDPSLFTQILGGGLDEQSLAGEIGSIGLVQMLNEREVPTEWNPGGDKNHGDFAGPITISTTQGRLHIFENAAPATVILQDPTDLATGTPHYALFADANTVTVEANGNTVATIATGTAVYASLGLNNIGQKTWYVA